MEDYKHKAAIGDYYVAMKQYIESMIEKNDLPEEQKRDYLNFLKELSVEFTKAIALSPRDIHLGNKPFFAKWKAKLDMKMGKGSISTEEINNK